MRFGACDYFSAACLSVAQHDSVVPFNALVDHRLSDFVVHLLLTRVVCEDVIEGVLMRPCGPRTIRPCILHAILKLIAAINMHTGSTRKIHSSNDAHSA